MKVDWVRKAKEAEEVEKGKEEEAVGSEAPVLYGVLDWAGVAGSVVEGRVAGQARKEVEETEGA